MSYRMLVGAGVAVSLTAATAMAQLPQNQQQTRRPGGSSQAKQLLQDLEGDWDLDIQIWSMQDAQRGTTTPGSQPGQSGQVNIQRIQQQIQQAMTQAGVSQQEAQQHAERLARQFSQTRPQQQQIQQQLMQAMTQAGVDREQAQQQAQRLSQQIHQQIQQPSDRPGLRPEDDDTTSPFRRPGQDREREQSQEYGEPTLRAEGSSSRQWVLDENILEEEVDFSLASEAPADRPMTRPGMQGDRHRDKVLNMLRDGQALEGRGMFGFDDETGNLYHVWADSSEGKIYFSVGEYNAQDRSVTFQTADAREIMNGMQRPGQTRPSQPGIRPGQPDRTPGTRPGSNPDDEPGATLISQQSRQPGQTQSPGMSDRSSDKKPRVVLRIKDDNEHVVEYYRADESGNNAVRTMVVTYTRNN